jgi:hypothetical protein
LYQVSLVDLAEHIHHVLDFVPVRFRNGYLDLDATVGSSAREVLLDVCEQGMIGHCETEGIVEELFLKDLIVPDYPRHEPPTGDKGVGGLTVKL